MSQIIYAPRKVANSEGRVLKNPRHFAGPVPNATKVYLQGHWPRIAAAYEAIGVPVADISDMRALPGRAKKPEPEPAQDSVGEASE